MKKKYSCPICHRNYTDSHTYPFCSKRCADIDLGRWFNEDYNFSEPTIDDMSLEEIIEFYKNK